MAKDNKDDSFILIAQIEIEDVRRQIVQALGKEIEVLAGAFDIVNAVVPTEFAAARERSAQLSRDLR